MTFNPFLVCVCQQNRHLQYLRRILVRLIEEKEERGKTGMYSFWKLKKKNVEEDEMTSITSTRNESCWTWEWMCNCRRSEARGPLSLPAGEDGQDHNQLRATQIKKIKKRGRRIVLERHFKNKKKKS